MQEQSFNLDELKGMTVEEAQEHIKIYNCFTPIQIMKAGEKPHPENIKNKINVILDEDEFIADYFIT